MPPKSLWIYADLESMASHQSTCSAYFSSKCTCHRQLPMFLVGLYIQSTGKKIWRNAFYYVTPLHKPCWSSCPKGSQVPFFSVEPFRCIIVMQLGTKPLKLGYALWFRLKSHLNTFLSDVTVTPILETGICSRSNAKIKIILLLKEKQPLLFHSILS